MLTHPSPMVSMRRMKVDFDEGRNSKTLWKPVESATNAPGERYHILQCARRTKRIRLKFEFRAKFLPTSVKVRSYFLIGPGFGVPDLAPCPLFYRLGPRRVTGAYEAMFIGQLYFRSPVLTRDPTKLGGGRRD